MLDVAHRIVRLLLLVVAAPEVPLARPRDAQPAAGADHQPAHGRAARARADELDAAHLQRDLAQRGEEVVHELYDGQHQRSHQRHARDGEDDNAHAAAVPTLVGAHEGAVAPAPLAAWPFVCPATCERAERKAGVSTDRRRAVASRALENSPGAPLRMAPLAMRSVTRTHARVRFGLCV